MLSIIGKEGLKKIYTCTSSQVELPSTFSRMKHLHLPHHHKHHRQVTVAEHKRNKRWMIGGSCLIVVGVFFFLLGILIQFVVFPVVMEALIYESIKLKPDTDAWDGWVTERERDRKKETHDFPTNITLACI